uniref:Uncharacterized protein n=1 Tax=Glossina palpalis gambiensis TaxID=67801 RepID=A0A1B0BRX3_9MUSC
TTQNETTKTYVKKIFSTSDSSSNPLYKFAIYFSSTSSQMFNNSQQQMTLCIVIEKTQCVHELALKKTPKHTEYPFHNLWGQNKKIIHQ